MIIRLYPIISKIRDDTVATYNVDDYNYDDDDDIDTSLEHTFYTDVFQWSCLMTLMMTCKKKGWNPFQAMEGQSRNIITV